jgi:ankyrin repeat protein
MRKIISILLVVIVIAGGTVFYSLSQDNIENLIVCSVDDGASYIPAQICEYYLFNLRGTPQDIAFLNEGAGLGFLVGISDREKRKRLMDFFIAKGVDVNGKSNIDGLTPLHAAILSNDHELVAYLIDKGANPYTKDRDNNMIAREFLNLLAEKNPDIDRSLVRKELKIQN